ncbi:bacillithiol system redox-active protein YtxJ [Ulvibacter antarcticus]|uniref:Bacillithiol system protein YtxJ n=1 Tax=Ulvibacter antarcticus TaxID=442714 RepID=A0A3L9Z3F6_9FLAO|nr:bacillithiol system redox-active protein YtxJ [Ulvibacter antarcticus]RMA64868.1 bacillithiol system protein YtxJ [Ulvibacter antarcticus]
MSLFGLFGSKESSEKIKETKQIPWKRLTSIDQLEEISEASKNIPVAIFKHSTRCGISKMVLRQFEASYNIEPEKLNLYFLDLLAHRDVSDEVGFKFQVMHQSPQLIVLKNTETVYHASHHSIDAVELEKFV